MRCSACQAENLADAAFCGECGAPVEAGCPTCGAANAPTAKFCRKCGKAMKAGTVTSQTRAPTRSEQPTTFGDGRYRVVRFLGDGATKRVYLARDTELGADVAFAIIKTEGLDEAGITRIRRQAQAMRRLGGHPHIVTLHDIVEENGQPCIITQFVAGADLVARLREAPDHRLPLAEAVRIAEQICDALEYAHQRGVVHRELKPANVWLTADGDALVGDFGLALNLDLSQLTTPGAVVASALYMPPERALGQQADARGDLYALGAILYEMVTGHPPFRGDDTMAIISQHLITKPVAPSWYNRELPKVVEDLILHLLAKAPEDRPAGAAQVRTALARVARARGSDAEPVVHGEADVLEPLIDGVFVGRREEMAHLEGAVESALAGRGRVVLLAGEQGIGKTRAAEEVATYARLRRARVLIARCAEGTEIPAFWPWIQILRAYAADFNTSELLGEMGPGASVIARMLPEIGEDLARVAPAPQLDAESARFRLFAYLATFFTNAAQRQPLLVMIDNLHWADGPSLMLLKFLARELRDTGTFFLCTYRDTELSRSDPRAEIVSSLRRESLFERITLGGLTDDEVRALLRAISGGSDAPESLAQTAHRESGGNPLFVGEIVRDLVETGTLRHQNGNWSSAAAFLGDLGFSDVRDVIEKRLSRSSKTARAVLEAAAVVGGAFDVDVVQAVAGLSAEEVAEALREGVRRRFVAALSPLRYYFFHGLVRQLLYDQLQPARRLELHRRAADRIEEVSREEAHQPQLFAIAQHLTQAAADGGAIDKAVRYATEVGAYCSKRLAYEEAAKYYQRALDLSTRQGTVDDRTRCELLLTLCDVLWPTAEQRRARDTALQASELARRLGDRTLLARAALALAPRLPAVGGVAENRALVDLMEEALAGASEAEGALRTRLQARLAEELLFTADAERRQTLARGALEQARAHDDPATLAFVLRAAHWALWDSDNAAERLELAEEIVRLGPLPEAAALEAYPLAIWDLIEAGDLDGARAELRLCSRNATQAPHPYLVWAAGVSQTLLNIVEGRLRDAEPLAQQTLQAALQAQNHNASLVFGFHAAAIHWLAGRLPEAERLLSGALQTFPRLAPDLHALLAGLFAEMGQSGEAQRHFDRAAQAIATHGRNPTRLVHLAALADACATIDGHPQGQALYDALSPFADRLAAAAPLLTLGPVALQLGVLAAALRKPQEALRHLEQALATGERLGMKPAAARSRFHLAQLLAERGGDGDEERAVALLDEALGVCREVGLVPLAEQARALRLRLRPEEVEPEPAPAPAFDAAVTAATMAADASTTAQTQQPGQAPMLAAGGPQRTELVTGAILANSYRLTEQIGKGGMGVVWAAQHLRLRGKRVAIKVLLEQASSIPEGYARFRHEAEIASRLGHPNIIEVLDFNELVDGTPYMVMEFLNGESLGQRMRQGPLPIASVIHVVRQIGSALGAAHREGVVHRDLKPENIYLCPTGISGAEHIKVLDFGISKMRNSDTIRTQMDVLIGTPRYMSPEQAMGRNDQIDARTDIFALGAIVYEMLTQKAAFSGDSLAQILYRIVHEPPDPLDTLVRDLPPQVAKAVARALEKDPEKRYAEVAHFVRDLG